MKKIFFLAIPLFIAVTSFAQLKWQNADSLFQPLPPSVHIYFTNDQPDTGAFRAYYLEVDMKDKQLEFSADTSMGRRLTPAKFYEKNNNPLVVINCTFFSFETNKSLNTVIKDGKLVAYNNRKYKGKGDDSIHTYYATMGTFGIDKKRRADIAWTKTDSSSTAVLANEDVPAFYRVFNVNGYPSIIKFPDFSGFHKWKMKTAIGGGPVLLTNGEIRIWNEEERMFTGKAINEKHPRTAIGYTKDRKLIILMVEGRNPIAHGATLAQEAQIFKDLGCVEALNLDGGGSSCMLINGKPTIKVSDSAGQRPVPAVFLIHTR